MFFCQRPADHDKPAADVFEIDCVRYAVHQRLQQKGFVVVGQLIIMPVKRFADGARQAFSSQLGFEQIILRSQRKGAGGSFFVRRIR